MVSVWTLPPDGATIEADGVLRLSDGRSFTLADIPGNGFKSARLRKIVDAVQALIDKRLLIAGMQADDPDKAPALAGDDVHFQSVYGGRRFIDGDSLVDRSTLFGLDFIDGVLVPTVTVVY